MWNQRTIDYIAGSGDIPNQFTKDALQTGRAATLLQELGGGAATHRRPPPRPHAQDARVATVKLAQSAVSVWPSGA